MSTFHLTHPHGIGRVAGFGQMTVVLNSPSNSADLLGKISYPRCIARSLQARRTKTFDDPLKRLVNPSKFPLNRSSADAWAGGCQTDMELFDIIELESYITPLAERLEQAQPNRDCAASLYDKR